MSWQGYIDDQLISSGRVKHAVICGHDGNVWATSKDFKPTPEELRSIIGKFDNVETLASTGITINGSKYMYISREAERPLKVVRAKKGTSGVHCIKTGQTYIMCVYEDPIVPEQTAVVAEKLGDYLLGVGF